MGWLQNILHWWFPPRPTPVPIPPPIPPPIPTGPPTALTQVRADVVTAINRARAANGLVRLIENGVANQVTQTWAETMAFYGTLDHGDFQARIVSAFGQVAAAEDIADGQVSAQQVVAGWLNSPPHRANIMGPYSQVGVGVAATGNGVLYWCADFIHP